MNQLIAKDFATVWLDDLSGSPEGFIPEELRAHLFEGAQRTYAVFDTGAVNEGLALVESDPGYCGSLLEGDDAENLADVMPCLLELSADGDLTKKLFREVAGAHPALGTLHLWPANAALFLRSNASPQELRRHLRRFLKPADEKGLRRYVRLWNPKIAFNYLRDLDASTSFLRLYLNGPQDPLTLIARNGKSAVVAWPVTQCTSADRPVLSQTDITALTWDLKTKFHERLVERVMARGGSKGYQFDRTRVEKLATAVMAEMTVYKPRDVPTMKDHEKLTLVLLMMHDDVSRQVLSGPVIRNSMLPWHRRVDVVAKSYLTGLRRMHDLKVV